MDEINLKKFREVLNFTLGLSDNTDITVKMLANPEFQVLCAQFKGAYEKLAHFVEINERELSMEQEPVNLDELLRIYNKLDEPRLLFVPKTSQAKNLHFYKRAQEMEASKESALKAIRQLRTTLQRQNSK